MLMSSVEVTDAANTHSLSENPTGLYTYKFRYSEHVSVEWEQKESESGGRNMCVWERDVVEGLNKSWGERERERFWKGERKGEKHIEDSVCVRERHNNIYKKWW